MRIDGKAAPVDSIKANKASAKTSTANTTKKPTEPNGVSKASSSFRSDHIGNADLKEEESDISLSTRVRAKDLFFFETGKVKVTFPGQDKENTLFKTEKQNLPKEVKPGVHYNNIDVKMNIFSRLTVRNNVPNEEPGVAPPGTDKPSNAGSKQ